MGNKSPVERPVFDIGEVEKRIEQVIQQVEALRHTSKKAQADYLSGYVDALMWIMKRDTGEWTKRLKAAKEKVCQPAPEEELSFPSMPDEKEKPKPQID